LKNPFSTTKLRLWQYLTFSIVTPFFIVGTLWLTFNKLIYTNQFKLKDGDLKQSESERDFNDFQYSTVYNLILGINLSIYMLVGFYSIIFAFRRLVRPGVSIEMRKLFFKKHALYVILLIFIWIIMITYNYYEIFNPHYIFSKSLNESEKVMQDTTFEQEKLNNDSIETLSQVAMFSTGELMVFIRLLDPFYKFLI
jgi:hypothetical protein